MWACLPLSTRSILITFLCFVYWLSSSSLSLIFWFSISSSRVSSLSLSIMRPGRISASLSLWFVYSASYDGRDVYGRSSRPFWWTLRDLRIKSSPLFFLAGNRGSFESTQMLAGSCTNDSELAPLAAAWEDRSVSQLALPAQLASFSSERMSSTSDLDVIFRIKSLLVFVDTLAIIWFDWEEYGAS